MTSRSVCVTALFTIIAGSAAAQAMPTTQPKVLDITREFEKPGHRSVHEGIESRWADANRQAGYPATYLALVSASGVPEIWWVSSYLALRQAHVVDVFGFSATTGAGTTITAPTACFNPAANSFQLALGYRGSRSARARTPPAGTAATVAFVYDLIAGGTTSTLQDLVHEID